MHLNNILVWKRNYASNSRLWENILFLISSFLALDFLHSKLSCFLSSHHIGLKYWCPPIHHPSRKIEDYLHCTNNMFKKTLVVCEKQWKTYCAPDVETVFSWGTLGTVFLLFDHHVVSSSIAFIFGMTSWIVWQLYCSVPCPSWLTINLFIATFFSSFVAHPVIVLTTSLSISYMNLSLPCLNSMASPLSRATILLLQ